MLMRSSISKLGARQRARVTPRLSGASSDADYLSSIPFFVRESGKLAEKPYAIGIGGFPPGWETGGKSGEFQRCRRSANKSGGTRVRHFRPLRFKPIVWGLSAISGISG